MGYIRKFIRLPAKDVSYGFAKTCPPKPLKGEGWKEDDRGKRR